MPYLLQAFFPPYSPCIIVFALAFLDAPVCILLYLLLSEINVSGFSLMKIMDNFSNILFLSLSCNSKDIKGP